MKRKRTKIAHYIDEETTNNMKRLNSFEEVLTKDKMEKAVPVAATSVPTR